MQRNESNALKRAAWLAEIVVALNEARRLIQEISTGDDRPEVFELYTEVEALRLDIESMQRRRFQPASAQTGPFRMQSFPPRSHKKSLISRC